MKRDQLLKYKKKGPDFKSLDIDNSTTVNLLCYMK